MPNQVGNLPGSRTLPEYRNRPRCSHCGGRLFLSNDYQGKRLLYSWECSACSRQYQLDGKPVAGIVPPFPLTREVTHMRKMVGVSR